MAIKKINGFKFYIDNDENKTLIIESSRLEECLDYLKAEKIESISINRFHGYKIDNLDFLKKCAFIKKISISDKISDFSGIYNLKDLNRLLVSDNKHAIDFSNFNNINEISIDWHSNHKNLTKCLKLEKLSIWHYKPKKKNIHELPNIENLKELAITQSTIKTLDGIEKYKNLESLKVHYSSKLETISCIQNLSETLKTLWFEVSKKIKDKEQVVLLNNLNLLAYINCGEIPSIDFINKLKNLKDFRFVDTNVLDGDISPCLNLDYAGFLKKKHYSHTPEEIKAEIAKQKNNIQQ